VSRDTPSSDDVCVYGFSLNSQGKRHICLLTSISDLDISGKYIYVVRDTLSSNDSCAYEFS